MGLLNVDGHGWASGVLIDEAHVLTCGHVLNNSGTLAQAVTFHLGYHHNGYPTGGGTAVSTGYMKRAFHGPITNNTRPWDIAVLRLGARLYPAGRHFPQLQIVAGDGDLPHNRELHIVGYPGNQHGEMWEQTDTYHGVDLGHHLIFHSHQAVPGYSGSPVMLPDSHRIVGVFGGLFGPHEDMRSVLITRETAEFVHQAVSHREGSDHFVVELA